jgi:transcriptional regulator with GAF, ATPase, and Fis domain
MSCLPITESGRNLGALISFKDNTELSLLKGRVRHHHSLDSLIGKDPKMLELFEHIREVSSVCLPVLIEGDSGTGKELVANAIHNIGPRADKPFVAVNCGALPESILESELFGHVRGAFSGAVQNRKGRFELANGGTLFLDEVGELSPAMQVKLLRVLQERSFAPVGSHKEQRFEGRIIAATNCTLDELLAAGRFRRDFFYRLSSNIIQVPPLRERLEDDPRELGELVDVLLARVVDEAGGSLRESVMEALDVLPAGYPWPGNVRELEQALRRIILNGRYVPDPLPGQAGEDPWLADVRDGRHDAAGLLAGYCRRLYDRLGTYEAVARVTGLDRRTAKRHIETGR